MIVGFSLVNNNDKHIFNADKTVENAQNINGYLVNGSNVFIENRSKPICDVPEICLGGQPIDDGNLTFTVEEKYDFLTFEPKAAKFFRPYMMGKDFIMRKPRYCLWLKDANVLELTKYPEIMRRINAVKQFRLASKRSSTLRAAKTPYLFGAPFEATGDYVAIPKVSSETRKYIPIDYLSKEIIPGDKLFVMQNATLYHFGILTSIVHMAWMRAVCGRLEMRYSYSNTIVYNNFPWPEWNVDGSSANSGLAARIPTAAQKILDVREKYLSQGASLADLYGENLDLLFTDLAEAHRELDVIVLGLYGLKKDATEAEMVGRLFELL